MSWNAVKKLHTALLDTQSGYEEAAADADDAELKALFSGMLELRQRDHKALHQALVEIGETPDDQGSFMAAVHRTVIGVRSTVAGLGTSSLKQFISGEEHILGEYDAALAEARERPQLLDVLRRQKSDVEEQVAQMRRKTA